MRRVAEIVLGIAISLGATLFSVFGFVTMVMTVSELRDKDMRLDDFETWAWLMLGFLSFLLGCVLFYGIYYYLTEWQQRD